MRRVTATIGRAALVFAAVLCALGTVIDAYDMPVEILRLGAYWAVAAVALSALASRFRVRGMIFSLPVILGLGALRLSELASGGRWLLAYVSGEFSRWLGTPSLFEGAEATQPEIMLCFVAIGIALAFLLTLALETKSSAACVLLITLPFVLLAAIIMDFAADSWFLVGLVGVWLVAVISGALHPDDVHRRDASVFPAFIAAALIFTAAYAIAPQKDFRRGGEISAIEAWIRDAVRNGNFGTLDFGTDWPDIGTDYWRFNTENVSIADAGRRTVNGRSLLEVSSDIAGTFYLRGYSMRSFDGRSWVDNADTYDRDRYYLPYVIPTYVTIGGETVLVRPEETEGRMTISKTGDLSSVRYLPYYVESYSTTEPLEVGFRYNEASLGDYVNFFYRLYDQYGRPDIFSRINDFAAESYTEVDPETARGLRELAEGAGIDLSASRAELSEAVADYVSGAADYTLSPGVVHEDEDFALYFLRDLREGYCVHFATAATLMLRALDVPARFTSGFAVTIPERSVGDTVTVTDRQAHAWVEVFFDDIGWVPLEVTPADSGVGVHRSAEAAVTPVPSAETTDSVIGETESSVPQINGQNNETDAPTNVEAPDDDDAGEISAVLFTALGVLTLIAALVLRRKLAQNRRRREFGSADKNAAVISAWGYIVRLLPEGSEPPEAVEELALKARFSCHEISEEERAAVVGYAQSLAAETDARCNFASRLWLRYVRALS